MWYFWKKENRFMKKLKFLFFVLLIANSFWSCEKDDICEDGTPNTPKLVIEFFDNDSPASKKIVNDLKVTAEGETKSLDFDNTNRIELPLKTDTDITKYSLILNDKNETVSLINEDKITINYTREDLYISRACGYKTLFTLDNTAPFLQETDAQDSKKWIEEIVVQKNKISNLNEVHVKIFF
jgi:hypothetical protein